MADNELSTSVDVNLELDRLITDSLERSMMAGLKKLKLPQAFIKQELGVDLDPKIDFKKVRASLERQRNELDNAIEAALSKNTRKGSVSLKGTDGQMREFQGRVEQFATLRALIDDQLNFMSQGMKDFSKSGVGKLITDLKAGKRKQADISPDEMREFELLSNYMGELSQQMRSMASRSRQIGRKVNQQVKSADLDVDYVALDRVPVILDSFARVGTRLAGLSKALPRVIDSLATAEKALEDSVRRASVITSQARTYVLPEADQRALIQGQKDSELAAGRKTIQERLKALADAEARGATLSAAEADEFTRLRTAGQFIKREQSLREKGATAFYDADQQAATLARQENERQLREQDKAAARRKADFESALRKRDEALRLSENALTRAAGAGDLSRLSAADREDLRGELVREAGSLRRLRGGFTNADSDGAINARLARLRDVLGELNEIKLRERAAAKADEQEKAAIVKAAQQRAKEEEKRAAAVGKVFEQREAALRLADNALSRAANAGDLRALDPSRRSQLQAGLGRELNALVTSQRGLRREDADPAIQAKINELRNALGQINALKQEERQQLAREREARVRAAAAERADTRFQGTQRLQAARVGDALSRAGEVGDFTQLSPALRNEMGKTIKGAITDLQKLRKSIGRNTDLFEESTAKLQQLEAYSQQIRAANRADAQLAKLREKGLPELDLRRQALAAEIERVGLGNLEQLAPEIQQQLPAYLRDQRKSLTAELGAVQAGGTGRSQEEVRADLAKNQKALDDLTAAGKRNMGVMAQAGHVFETFFRYALGYGALYQVLGAVTALTRGVIDLEAKLAEIKAVAGLTAGEMRIVATSVEETAGKYAFSVEQISEATLTLAQAGVEMKDIGSTLNAVAAFATATGSNLQQAADLITSLRDVYDTLDPATIGNVLTQSVNISKLTGSDLQTIIGLSAGVAKSFNLSAEQYLAAASTLRNAGLKASTVATGLRQTMLEVFNPDAKLLNVLEKRYKAIGEKQTQADIKAKFFGFSQDDNALVTALNELERLGLTGSAKSQFEGAFDIRSRNVIEALSRNRGDLSSFEAQLGAGNATSIAAAENLQTVKGALQQLRNEATLLASQLTEDMLPGIREFINGLSDMLQSLRELDQSLKAGGGRGISSVLATSVVPAGLLGALATPGGFMRKVGAFAGYGTAAGVGAIGGTAAANAAGTGSKVAELIGDAAGLALPALLGRIMAKSTPIVEGSAGPIAKAFGNVSTRVMELLPRLGSLGAMVAATGPLGVAVAGIATVLAGIGAYRTLSGNSATERFNAATDRIAANTDDYRTSRRAALEYGGQIAGAGTELKRLQDESTQFNKMMTEFFGDNAGEVTLVNQTLQQIYKQGLDATGETRKALVEKLNEYSDKPLSDELINNLARMSSELDSQSTAIITNAAREYERIQQLGENAAESDKARATAFDQVFNETYRAILGNPASVGPAQRLVAIDEYHRRIRKLETEAATKKQTTLKAELEEANKAFTEAAVSDPVNVGDRARTIVNLLEAMGTDVVAGLDKQIAQLEEAARLAQIAARNENTPEAAERVRLLEEALSGTKRERTARFNDRNARNAAVAQDESARMANLAAEIKKRQDYGLPVPEEALSLQRTLQAGGGVAYDEGSKTYSPLLVDKVNRQITGLANENERSRRGRENSEARQKLRDELDRQVAEQRNESKLLKVTSRTGTLSQTAEGLGLDPASLGGSIADQAAALIAAGKSGTTLVDQTTKTLLDKAQFELDKVNDEIDTLSKEGDGGDTEKNQKAMDLMQGKQRDLLLKIEKYKGERDEKNEELTRKALVQLADKYEEEGKTQLAATKKRFDDAVAAGQLTADRLERFSQQERAVLDQLAQAFRTKLMADKNFYDNGKFTDEGNKEMAKFLANNRSAYAGVEGAKGLITSAGNAFNEDAARADLYGAEDSNLERQRRSAARGSDFAGNLYDIAIAKVAAKQSQLEQVREGLRGAEQKLLSIDMAAADASLKTQQTTEQLALLTKEQEKILTDLDDLSVKAEQLNGSLSEEFDQIWDNLSPAAFADRAALGTEALSEGVGSALEQTINGIGDAFVDAQMKGRSFKDSMKSLAAEVGEALAKMLAREGVKQLLSFIVGGIGSFFGAKPVDATTAPAGIVEAGGRRAKTGWADISVENYAQGGTIIGPGTDTSDSIPGYVVNAAGTPVRPIRVSNGESILTGKATRLLGKRTIEMLNKGQMPMQQQVATMGAGMVTNTNNTMLQIDIPVVVGGDSAPGGGGNVNHRQLQDALRSAVAAEIEKQKRPGGALHRR